MGAKKLNRKQWLWEFSKKIVVLVAVVYTAALLHDRIFLWFYPDNTALPMLSEQMGSRWGMCLR